METTLRQLYDNACSSVAHSRHPNTRDFEEVLNPVLLAACGTQLMHEQITSISESVELGETFVYICTTYTLRQCAMEGDYRFPLSLIDSTDPIRDGRTWFLQQKLAKVQGDLTSAEQRVKQVQAALTAVTEEINQHNAGVSNAAIANAP